MPIAFPIDHSEALPPGASTPTSRQSPTPSRKETILSLVEMLLAQGDDLDRGGPLISNFEDDRDVPTVDEHLQVVGAEAFNRFQRRINNLDKELRNFANASRQLGSSVAILSSAFHLRERLAQILYLYHENAADLFPRKITHISRETVDDTRFNGTRHRHGKMARYKAPPHVARPTVHENLDPEFFPDQLNALATDVTTFLNCLNEFPEFTDEAVNASILSFEGDLRYWASCLKEYAGHLRSPAVQRYIHDLSMEMGEHIDTITATLAMFVEVGVPTIRFAQKHGASNLLNLSTVATFFSAVTATTLQFSFELEHSSMANSVNCFWFLSLVFSIGAAVNSLLGLTWKQAMYRSPGHRVPWWVMMWIKRSPLVFLVVSVACFSVGLCCFAYASRQAHITSILTSVFTAFTSFGLAAVSTWFASERWIFLRHRGTKWLSDVLNEWNEMILQWRVVQALLAGLRVTGRPFQKAHKTLQRLASKTVSKVYAHSNASTTCDDLEAALPTHTHNAHAHPFEPPANLRRTSDLEKVVREPPKTVSLPSSPTEKEQVQSPTTSSPGRQLWKNAVRSVKMRSVVASPLGMNVIGSPREPRRQRTTSSTLAPIDRKRATLEEPVRLLRSRVADLIPKVKDLETTQDIDAHQALVKHLQFSPDGKFLATSSWDRTSVIFRVEDPVVTHRILAHPQGFVGQVAWSPTGNTLLTKLARGIKIWTAEDGVCKKTINRDASIESITWFPDGNSFISVEGSNVTKLNLKGDILDTYDFGCMKLHDVAITPDSVRLIGVGPLLKSPTGLQPSKSRAEKRLVVYNMETKQIENQIPVLNDVRDITVAENARSGVIALVSYENKAPPQLWKLEMVRDRENNSVLIGRLALRHTYMPKVPVDFAGPSYFGGKNLELVLCAGKAGDIHIWDQESGALVHHIRSQTVGGDLTCIAWNHASIEPFMFATGGHDGAVRIWTKRSEDTEPTDYIFSQSPFELNLPQRSNSPDEQPDDDSVESHESSSQSGANSSVPLLRDRIVAFASQVSNTLPT
ncbi:hypothetical protein BDZ94DRAFT_1326045 [Collybia nuda]|uniref:WD40 repeat-like protein n=1 Tax=Collybia nuda TaxID=64659 RepID=A0A9P5XY02_9AGAR|nr:hypothetical protein BDZ94DRAFT_1326045 [Collybia nuda]